MQLENHFFKTGGWLTYPYEITENGDLTTINGDFMWFPGDF